VGSGGEHVGETIYLVGTSGYPNYGDEFIAAAWLRHLAAARPEAEVWLDCPNPGQASHLFSTLHPRLRITDTLWRLAAETAPMARAEADDHVTHRVQHLGTPRYDLGLLALRRISTLHLIGGGHINGMWPTHLALVRAAAALREVTDVRLVATGLGLTPAPEDETLLGSLKGFDHITVRDSASADLTGADLAPDDAFLAVRDLAGFGGQPEPTARGDVYVCLQHDLASPDTFDNLVEATRRALPSPALEGRTVHYLEAIPGTDRIAYDRLADLIPEENFVPFLRLWGEGLPAQPGQTWITTRFHLHMLAAACGAQGTALEVNEDYYRVKHGSLIELGTGWSITPAGSATLSEPAVSKGFPYKVRMVAQEKLDEARRIYPEAPPQPAAATPEESVPTADARRRGWRSRR
jgi:hypothetical protein